MRDGYSLKTVKNHIAVEALFARAAELGIITSIPRLPKVYPPVPKFDHLTIEEAERVIAATPPERQTWVLLLMRTGIRLGEALALKSRT
jgi:integrase